MAFITLRQANVISSPGGTVKGSPLTNAEVDNNFANINLVIGFRENLITSANANLVAAVNEVRSDLDNLSSSKISNGTSNVNISTANGDIEITANLIPNVSNVINLGSSTRRFKDLYLTGNTINLGGDTISSVDGFIRINNANVFTTSGLISSSNVRLLNSTGTMFVELRANAALASNITFRFPSVDGTSGQALVTDAAGNLSFAAAGATLTDDTTTNSSFFPVITTSTSGALTAASVSSTKLSFNPSTGRVSATVFSGSGADLGSLNAGNISSGTLSVTRGGTGNTSATFVSLTSNVYGTLPVARGGTGNTSGTFVSLTSNVYGTLPVANGGTGNTSATFVSLTSNVYGTLSANNGGTGVTGSQSNGRLLIGNGSAFTSNTLTGTSNQISVTNGVGSIILSTPQSINTTSSVQFATLGIGTGTFGSTGDIRATNNITAFFSSDNRYKENIRDIDRALDKVVHIGGKYFDWTDNYISSQGGPDGYFMVKSDFGVIAQDVREVFPVAVRERLDGSLAVDYEKLVSLAFAAIKELKEEINKLK